MNQVKYAALVLGTTLCCFGAYAQHVEFAGSPDETCRQLIRADERFTPLKADFRATGESTFVRYAKNGKPTDAEKALIAQYMTEIDKCRNRSDVARWRRDNFDPVLVSISDESYSAFVALVVRLHNGEITYGEYHRNIDSAIAQHNARWDLRNAELDRLDAQNAQAQAQYDSAQRARNAAMMQQAVQGFQQSLQPKQPIRTNCHFVGGSLSCSSQ